jgi:hypothetical protein
MPILEGRVGALIESMQETNSRRCFCRRGETSVARGFCPCRSSARRPAAPIWNQLTGVLSSVWTLTPRQQSPPFSAEVWQICHRQNWPLV